VGEAALILGPPLRSIPKSRRTVVIDEDATAFSNSQEIHRDVVGSGGGALTTDLRESGESGSRIELGVAPSRKLKKQNPRNDIDSVDEFRTRSALASSHGKHFAVGAASIPVQGDAGGSGGSGSQLNAKITFSTVLLR
jgi:hypothetical protein